MPIKTSILNCNKNVWNIVPYVRLVQLHITYKYYVSTVQCNYLNQSLHCVRYFVNAVAAADVSEIPRSSAEAVSTVSAPSVNPLTKEQLQQAFIHLLQVSWLCVNDYCVFSLLHARPSADGWPLMWVNRPLEVRQPAQLSLLSSGVDKWVVSYN